uniref:Sulfotransferase n=1 Tax=Callorhinchus milii TaxID=7868 RepID=V9KX03_CALMI
MDLSVIRKSQLIPFRGVPLPNYFLKNMEKVGEFEADKTDVLIATYPKAGTTWMQEIVDCVLHGGDVRQCEQSPIHYRSPFLEAFFPEMPSGLELLAEIPSPKPIKTHLPFQLIPTSFLQKQCKIIYCARNAKDNVVSFFHFDRMNMLQPDPGTWEEFLQKFLTGNVTYGLWHDHVKGWWEQRGNFPILYMFYEDMKEDPRREIKRVAEFLGKELGSKELDTIVAHTSFNAMKLNPMTNYSTIPLDVLDQRTSPFMRKGIVGNWKTHFTVAQNQMFEEDYCRRMVGSTLHFRTELKPGDNCL